jgi:hypothetical protein
VGTRVVNVFHGVIMADPLVTSSSPR